MRQAWLRCAGAGVLADPSGALLWPEQALLVVADLHFEKGSSAARRGSLLPPYDTRATLACLEAALARLAPRTVISLGDGFHDRDASLRLPAEDRARLAALVARHDWIWLVGNHDPRPPTGLGGRSADRMGGVRHDLSPYPGGRAATAPRSPAICIRAPG